MIQLDKMSYGFELELSNVLKSRRLPDHFGKWEYTERDIVNTVAPYRGIAADPLGQDPPVGGEINTRPTATWGEQVALVGEIVDWFTAQGDKPEVGLSSHSHIHVHVPGLTHDIAALKKLMRYIRENQEDMVRLCGQFQHRDDMPADAHRYLKFDGGRLTPPYIFDNIEKLANNFDDFIRLHCAGKDGISMGRPFRFAINAYCLKHIQTVEFRMFRGTIDRRYLENAFRAVEMFMREAFSETPRKFADVWREAGWICAPMQWDAELWAGLQKTKKPEGTGKKARQYVPVGETIAVQAEPVRPQAVAPILAPACVPPTQPACVQADVPRGVPAIVPITREQFMSRGNPAKPHFTGADGFCTAFYTKCDSQCGWDTAKGIFIDGKLAAAIVTTISKREPHVANLQLVHTFSEYRGRGLGRILTMEAVYWACTQGAKYFRVSAEPEAVAFYEKLGFKFLGKQKSGCQLSIFRMGGSAICEGVYDTKDPIIQGACCSTRKGGLHEVFPAYAADLKVTSPEAVSGGSRVGTAEHLGAPNVQRLPKSPEGEGNSRQAETAQAVPLFDEEEVTFLKQLVREEVKDLLREFFGLWIQPKMPGIPMDLIRKDRPPQPAASLPVAPAPAPAPASGTPPAAATSPPQVPSNPAPAAAAGEIVHFKLPRGGTACKVDGPRDPDITKVNCERCRRKKARWDAEKGVQTPPPADGIAKVLEPRPPKTDPKAWMTPERFERVRNFVAEMRTSSGYLPEVVNIRGTSGSGKSYIVHQLIAEAREKGWLQPMEGGGKILGYVIQQPNKTPITIIGPYETACGGCDAFSQRGCLDLVYDMVERAVTEKRHHVIFEGLIVCADFQRTVDLTKAGFPLEVCLLNSTFEECRDRCNERRAKRGDGPLDDKGLMNLRQKYDGNTRSVPRFKEAGVHVNVETAADIVQRIREKMYS